MTTSEPSEDATERATDAAPGSDEAILAELRDDYDYDVDSWAKIREQAAIDVEYASNNTWTTADEVARAGRPMLNLDQLSQYRNQVENTVRQNKRGVKVSPAGNGATDKSAELRANRIREIEYQGHAQEAYSQAFSDCLTRSYGFAGIVAEYEDEAGDHQVFRPRSIPNPNQVVPDADGQSTSGRDWKRCFFLTSMSHREFRRDYPDAAIKDFDASTIASAGPRWLSATRVTVAEAWRVIETPQASGKGKPKREVCMYLTNGVELLAKKGQPKKHPWKGKYIPFAACLGRVIYKTSADGDTEKQILSYIRFARDSAKGFNYAYSTILEKMALPVKASLMGYEGQADVDTIADITRATREHVPWLQFKPVMDATGQAVLPLPQYGTREPDLQADMIVAEGFQRNIQNALGHFNANDARLGPSKVTSGVALAELKRSGDLGSYDFQDHYDDFLKFMGEQYDDLLEHYDDTAKEVATRAPDNTTKMVTINTPTGRDQQGNPVFKPTDARIVGAGTHTITIATGPNSDSQREAGKDAAMAMIGNAQAFPYIAADAVRLMDLGAVGDQMAEDLEFLQPPAMQQARQAKAGGGAPDPRQLQQQLEQVKQQLQQLEGVAKEMDAQLKGKQAEIASKEKIATMQADTSADLQLALQVYKNAAAIAIAHIGAAAKGVALNAHAAEEAQALGHDAEQNEHDRAHEVGMAGMQQAHLLDQGAAEHDDDLETGDVAHSQALEAGDIGHQQSLALGQQAADLAPPPAPASA